MTAPVPPAVTDPSGVLRAMLAPHLEASPLEGGGVLVHGERVSRVFSGGLYERLIPLLDGARTVEAIVEELASEWPHASVYYAVLHMQSLGLVLEAPAPRGDGTTAFWTAAGDASGGVDGRGRLAVDLRALHESDADGWVQQLEGYGIRRTPGAALTLVFAPGYLDHRLDPINREAIAAGRSWMLCKPSGTVLWLGPLFVPGVTACWACLRHRLERNLPIDAYLAARRNGAAPGATASPWTRDAAMGLLATQLARLAVDGEPAPVRGAIVTVDALTLESHRHPVSRRPQCARCGDASLYARRPGREIALSPVPAISADGGHRAVQPLDTVTRWMPLVDPLTGVLPALERAGAGNDALHVYSAGANMANPADSWREVRASLRRNSGGKGLSDVQARASAIGEAIERYSGRFEGDEPRRRASLRELGDQAIHPNRCLLFSEAQLRDRDALGAGPWGVDRIPVPFDEAVPEDWTPVWSLTEQRAKYLPTGMLYFRFHGAPDRATTISDSNGNAAGNTVEEAVLQGFLELVERDSTALWWYNRIRRPGADLDTLDAPEWPALRREYERLGREVWLLDLTSDLGIPVFAAVSRRAAGGPESILVGLGAHFDAQLAASRALSELNQMLVTIDAEGSASLAHQGLGGWLQNGRLADLAFLAPTAREGASLRRADAPAFGDLRDAVRWCQALVERHGMEMLVLDQTRPDVEIPVVKVIVPGLRHFRARFAPGRLYDVPVALGWLDRPLPEAALNPIPFFL